jgi:ATP phosphoribosyltransferase
VLRAASSKYIMLHCDRAQLDAIKKILPGAEDPTILPLHSNPDKVVVHAVCNENIFWDTMEQLRDKGASSILVTPIEKMLY